MCMFLELIYLFIFSFQLSSHPLRQLLIASPFIRYKWSLQPLEQGSGRNLSMLSAFIHYILCVHDEYLDKSDA